LNLLTTADRKKVNIKAILTNPLLRSELVHGATEFICNFARVPQRDVLASTQPSSPMANQPLTRFITQATVEKVQLALQAGLEAAEDEHNSAQAVYGERKPLRVRWYAEQVELIRQAVSHLANELEPPNGH
jgi:hypothetical protein